MSKTEQGILFFIGVSFLLCFLSLDIKNSLKVFFNNYFYRMMPLFAVMLFGILKLEQKQVEIIKRLIYTSIFGYLISSCYVIYQALVLNMSRPNGFFGNPMTYAGWNCLFVPMLFILFMETNGRVNFSKKIFYLASLIMGLLGTVFNATRGSWLAIIIVLLALIVYYGFNGYKKLSATILIFCIALPIGFGILQPNEFKNSRIVKRATNFDLSKDKSSMERIYLWKSSIQMVKDYPLAGIGLGRFGDLYQEKYILKEAGNPHLNHAHNNFFQVAAETGIIGLFAFLAMFALNYKEQYSFWKRTKSKYSLIILAMTVCLLLQGFTQYNFGDSAVIKNYWLMLALFLAINKMGNLKKETLEFRDKKEQKRSLNF